jgi:hypothetical protein
VQGCETVQRPASRASVAETRAHQATRSPPRLSPAGPPSPVATARQAGHTPAVAEAAGSQRQARPVGPAFRPGNQPAGSRDTAGPSRGARPPGHRMRPGRDTSGQDWPAAAARQSCARACDRVRSAHGKPALTPPARLAPTRSRRRPPQARLREEALGKRENCTHCWVIAFRALRDSYVPVASRHLSCLCSSAP